MDHELIGRDSELSRLRRVVDRPAAQTQILVLLGESGMGEDRVAGRCGAAGPDVSNAGADGHRPGVRS